MLNFIYNIKIKTMISDKFIDLIADGRIKINGCQIILGNENTISCNIGENGIKESNPTESRVLNEHLNTDDARKELAKYQKAGYLDENFQPIDLTRPQMGCIAISVGAVLGLTSQWKDFGSLWGIDSEQLRTQFSRGRDSEPTRKFFKKIYSL